MHGRRRNRYLRDVFEPASERDEDEEHRGRLEERPRTVFVAPNHGDDEDDDGVGVRDGGREGEEDVHVGGAVSHRLHRLRVEVTASEELDQPMDQVNGPSEGECQWTHVC